MIKFQEYSFFKINDLIHIYISISLAVPFVNLIKINYYLQLQIQIPIILNALLIFIWIINQKEEKQNIPIIALLLPLYIALNISWNQLWSSQLIFFIDILLKIYLIFVVAPDLKFSQSFKKQLGFTISMFVLFHVLYAYYSLYVDNSRQQNILFSNFFLGVFNNPTKLTNYCVLFSPLILKYCSISSIAKRRDVISLINLVIIALLAFILMKNNSRIDLFCLLAILVFRYTSEKSFNVLRKTILIGVILLLVSFTVNLFIAKENSFNGRFFILKITTSIIKSNFWFGTGFNTYESEYNKFQGNYFAGKMNNHEIILADDNYVCHNEFLQTFSELGFVGLSIILILVFYLVRKLRQKIINIYTISFFDFIILLLILSFFSYPFRTPEMRDAVFLNIMILLPFKNIQKSSSMFSMRFSFSKSYITILSIISLTYVFYYQYELFSWGKKCDIYLVHRKNVENKYLLINYNKNFLYTEAVINLKENNYVNSLILVENLEKVRLSSSICMLKAEVYKQLDNPVLVLKEYKRAVNINPKLLRPKYEIMKYYRSLNKPLYAKFWARKIITTPVKIQSATTEFFQERANKILTE